MRNWFLGLSIVVILALLGVGAVAPQIAQQVLQNIMCAFQPFLEWLLQVAIIALGIGWMWRKVFGGSGSSRRR